MTVLAPEIKFEVIRSFILGIINIQTFELLMLNLLLGIINIQTFEFLMLSLFFKLNYIS